MEKPVPERGRASFLVHTKNAKSTKESGLNRKAAFSLSHRHCRGVKRVSGLTDQSDLLVLFVLLV